MKKKLSSRKFWLSVASMSASVGTTLAGFASENDMVVVIGAICTAISAGIYSYCEAIVDLENVSRETITDSESEE